MYHQITVIGRLTSDPDMRYFPDGREMTRLNLATDDGFGDKKKTIWFRVATFGKTASACNQYLSKGNLVAVIGRLNADEGGNPRIWTSQDGKPRADYEINAQRVVFLNIKGSAPEQLALGGLDEPETASIPF